MWRALLISIATCLSAVGAEWHVAPGAAGVGTAASPGSFITAYAHTGWAASIAAGDTVWVHGGAPYTYSTTNRLVLAFSGSAGSPVTWKAWPYEKPMLHFGFTLGNQNYHSWEGLGWTDPYKHLRTNEAGWFDASTTHPHFEWRSCTLINTPGIWTGSAGGKLIRGCVLLNTGFDLREHGVYPTSSNFVNNVVGWCAGDVLEGTGPAAKNISSNIIFGTSVTIGAAQKTMLVGFGTNISVLGNLLYEYTTGDHKGIHISAGPGAVIAGNVIAAPTPFTMGVGPFTFTNNTVFASRSGTFNVVIRSDNTGVSDWNRNAFYDVNDAVRYDTNGIGLNKTQWTATTGYDVDSTSSDATKPPDSVWPYRLPDDPFRIFLAVYNWSGAHNVTVTNLVGMIQAGNTYSVKSFQNYEGALVQSGTFNGTSISLPMTNLAVAVPTWAMFQPTNTSPHFAAFEVVMGGTKASGGNFSGGVLK